MKYKHYTLAFAAMTAALSAQTENSPAATETDEIVTLPAVYVTGELWESALEKTTASVSVIDSASLELKASQHFDDLVNSVPNLTWTGGTSRPRYFQIRGIGENSQFEGETPDSSVRFLIDDFDLTGLGSVANLFDVQQVEVLRGPQAGAFGANAAGGVVRVVTNQPTSYWSGQVETTVGSDSLFAGGVAVGGPLIETDPEQLTFRLSIHQLFQDGFRDNQFLNRDDTNQRDELSSQLKLRWIANPDWQWDLGLLYADTDNGYDEFSLGNTGFDTTSDQPGEDNQETFGTSLRGTWTGLDKVDVTSITTFVTTDSYYSFDGDWTNPTDPLFSGTSFLEITRDRDVFSQEVRFDSSDEEDALGFIDRWTVGAYYQSMDEFTDTTGFGTFQTDYESQTSSLYGQATHLISDRARVTLGLRTEYFDLETEQDSRPDAAFDDLLFGGKLTFEYDFTDDHTGFVSATKGYKAGGANIYPYIDPALPVTYDSENLWNYELGLRSEWFDGSLTSKFTVYYMVRDDEQVRGSSGSGISYSYFTVNGDEAIHYGAEGEVTWFLSQHWTANAALGIQESDREGFAVAGAPTVFFNSGDVASVPLYSYSVNLSYNNPNGIFGRLEVNGRDEFYESNDPDGRNQNVRNAFTTVNTTIGYRYENWTFSFWVKNLFDEAYEKRVFYFDNGAGKQRYESPADPRQFGVTANYSF